MLPDIAVAAVARVGEGGIEIERAPEGIRFEPLFEYELLGSLFWRLLIVAGSGNSGPRAWTARQHGENL